MKFHRNQFRLLILQVQTWYLLWVPEPQVLALPMQLFSLGRLRQGSGLWMERLTEAVHRGGAWQLHDFLSFFVKLFHLLQKHVYLFLCLWNTTWCILSPLLTPERLCWKRWQILWVGWGLWGGLPPPQGTQPLRGKDGNAGNEGLPSQSHFQKPAY